MPVIRSKSQSSQSLEEFYDFLVNQNELWKNTRNSMLDLINKINEEFPDRTFYALTSHSRLVILENEKSNSNWLMIFSSRNRGEYSIDSMLPGNKSSSDNDRKIIEAKGVEKALEHFKLILDNFGLLSKGDLKQT